MVVAMSTAGWVILESLPCASGWLWRFGPHGWRGRKGHSFMGFFLLSLLFFPLAIILVYMADDRTGVLVT